MQRWAAAGSATYAAEVKDVCRTLPQILDELPSVALPLGAALELLPRMAPRYYSISSAPSVHGSRIHVTAVVVRHPTGTKRIHTGLCTGWLARIAASPDHAVACFVRRSAFKLPVRLDAPMLMFGPGTGVAPFRGFLHELRALSRAGELSDEESLRILYYGW